MSNLGKWESWYKDIESSEPYGDSQTYLLGASYLSDCSSIEDWGCGKGWFANYIDPDIRYTGVDGSHSKFADRIVDLENYTTTCDGIFIRHVLEHNVNWQRILKNAVESFQEKMVVCIFTPFSRGKTKQIGYTDSIGVPDLSLSKKEVESYFSGLDYEYRKVDSPETFYGKEHIYFVTKNKVS